jgi:hypothetical protein
MTNVSKMENFWIHIGLNLLSNMGTWYQRYHCNIHGIQATIVLLLKKYTIQFTIELPHIHLWCY